PTYSYGTSGADEQFYSDSYYGQLTEEDFYPELLVGRLSGTTQQMPRIIQKILNYETTPLAGTWMTNAIGIASNEGSGYGDEGEADFEHLRGIGDQLLEFGYNTIYEFYQDYQEGNDEWGDPTPEMISAAIDEGVGLINYTGHGATQIMSTGSYTNADVNQLNNTGKFPFVVSVACNNGTFVGGTALCESFLTASQGLNPTGAIAACGSSILMAWAEPMQTQDEIAALITRANPTSTATTLGGLFFNGQLSMLETYGNSPTAIEVMQTWIMFGDPTVVFRSTSFDELAATHPAEVSQSGQTITVNSSSNGARVFLTQNNIQFATAVIAEGAATLEIPNLASNDPIKITLTKVNAKPYRSSINVSSPLSVDGTSSKNVQVFPNPVRNVLTVNLIEAEKAVVKILDLNGRVVLEQDFSSNSAQIDMSQLSNGMYLAVVETSNGRVIKKLSKE
ncbi:C25 family cysteine peptidase, partial [Flavobacterium sp.]|uniref:C25 family cysteine peptidase n=1 Tax=Flavobacterium sp. TaxID=239 RepID=UPI003B9AAFA8